MKLIKPYTFGLDEEQIDIDILLDDVPHLVNGYLSYVSSEVDGLYGRFYTVLTLLKEPSGRATATRRIRKRASNNTLHTLELQGVTALCKGSVEEYMYEKPHPAAPAPNEFLFFNKLFGPKTASDYSSKVRLASLAVRRNIDNKDGFKYRTDSSAVYLVEPTVGELANLHQNKFPFRFSTMNGIDDCGFASVTNMYRKNIDKRNPELNALLLLFFFQLELILSSKAYILFSLRAGDPPTKLNREIALLNIFYDIAKYSGINKPIINPNNGDLDYDDMNPFLHRNGMRNRELCAITHYGLLDYYQSPEFKELNLIM